jgi:putative FmdB family regulatory protein
LELFEVFMPIYTYRCESCGVQFERNQKFSDAPLTRCPECGKKSLRKVYTPVGIVFKGSGFYATDHRSPSGASRSSNSHDEKPSGESKSADNKSSSSSESSSSSGTSSKESE